MKLGDTYGGAFFKGEASVVSNPVLTIKSVREHKWDDSDKPQWVLSFQEDERELGMNKTNAEIVAEICKPGVNPDMVEDTDLIGGRIELYWDPTVSFGGKRTGGIRVRPPSTQARPATNPTEATWGEDSATKFRDFLIGKIADCTASNVNLVTTEIGSRCGLPGSDPAQWPVSAKKQAMATANQVADEIAAGTLDLDDSSFPF